MKKALQFMLCALIASSSYGQTIFSADFEDGTLGGMTIVDNDGLTPAANVAPFSDAWTITTPAAIAALSSTGVISNSWYSPAGQADDWLITPQVMIAESGTALLWNAQAIDANFADGLEVRVSTTDAELGSFTDVIYTSSAESAEFTQRIAVLDDYVGQEIYIAFRNNSVDKFLLLIDDIEVKRISARNVKILSFGSVQYHVKNENIPVSINILNDGGDVLTSLDLTWTDGNDQYTETITGLNIATGETATITSSTPFIATEAVSYMLSVEIANPNGADDFDDSDNAIEAVVSGVSYIPSRRVIGEEGTGTWCGWCPRGSVALDYMEANFKEEFIGIAVHNDDPMVVADYDSNLGVTGFPGGKVNRLFDVDPGNFEAAFNVVKEIITPVAIEVAASGNEEDRTITIKADAEFVTQLADVDFRISAVVMEDGVTGTGSGYDQVNFYSGGQFGDLIDVNGVNWADLSNPVLAADMVYDHVARAVLGGFDGVEGSVESNLLDGDQSSQEFNWSVPDGMDMTKMYAVVLIIDNETGEILNGAKTEVALLTSTNEIVDQTISNIYPNPVSHTAIIDINLKQASEVSLQVVDMMGKVISNENLGKLSGLSRRSYDVSALTSGVYTFRITAGDFVSAKKISVVK